jgi:isopenicillin N synthase-like dioxygenase
MDGYSLIENTLIMNIGDMMEILQWTLFSDKASGQKVKEERILFLYFSCDYDYLIQPVVETDQPKYAPLKGGEHLFNQTAQTFQYLKNALNKVIWY